MSFVLSNLHMNNQSNNIVSTIKQYCRWCTVIFIITLINAKTWVYELNSNFKNKSEWTLSFYEFRSEQTGSGSRSYIFKENKIISLTNLFQQYIKNLSEWEIEFLSSYYREKCSNAYKIRKSVLLD